MPNNCDVLGDQGGNGPLCVVCRCMRRARTSGDATARCTCSSTCGFDRRWRRSSSGGARFRPSASRSGSRPRRSTSSHGLASSMRRFISAIRSSNANQWHIAHGDGGRELHQLAVHFGAAVLFVMRAREGRDVGAVFVRARPRMDMDGALVKMHRNRR